MGSKTKSNSIKNQKMANVQLSQVMKQLGEVDMSLFQMAIRLEAVVKLLIDKGVFTQDDFKEYLTNAATKYINTPPKPKAKAEVIIKNSEIPEDLPEDEPGVDESEDLPEDEPGVDECEDFKENSE